MRLLRYPVGPEDRGRRLDQVLAEAWPGLSRSRIQSLFKSGHVTVDGVPGRAGARARPGTVAEARLPAPEPSHLDAEPMPLAIVYEDEHLLVVDKPAGLVVHPGAGVKSGTLANALLAHCPTLEGVGGVRRPGLVHRLDKDTSGLLVVAKTDAAFQALTRALRERAIHRRYLALVWGVPRGAEGRVEAAVGRDPRERKRMAVLPAGRPGARPAATRYRLVAALPAQTQRPAFALLECELETGRTHQIRVHLSHVGHPIMGDATYGGGGKKALSLSPGLRKLGTHLVRSLGRQALHAACLEFRHPISGRALRFEAPLPEDMARALSLLGFVRRP